MRLLQPLVVSASGLNGPWGSLLGLCIHDHKSMYAALMICSTMVNIKSRHTQIAFWRLTSLYAKLSQAKTHHLLGLSISATPVHVLETLLKLTIKNYADVHRHQ